MYTGSPLHNWRKSPHISGQRRPATMALHNRKPETCNNCFLGGFPSARTLVRDCRTRNTVLTFRASDGQPPSYRTMVRQICTCNDCTLGFLPSARTVARDCVIITKVKPSHFGNYWQKTYLQPPWHGTDYPSELRGLPESGCGSRLIAGCKYVCSGAGSVWAQLCARSGSRGGSHLILESK